MLSTTIAFAQSKKTFEGEVKKISNKIDLITKQQKDSLKMKVKEINLKLDKGQLSSEQAEIEKKKAAMYHASRIEKLVSVQQKKLQQLVQDKTDGKIFSNNPFEDDDFYVDGFTPFTFAVGNRQYRIGVTGTNYVYKTTEQIHRKWRRRTTSELVFAFGVNNVLLDNQFSSLGDSPYRFWQSRFYEYGLAWKYRLSKEPSSHYLKYGFSFVWNNLRPDNQEYHVLNGNQTSLVKFPTSEGEIGDVRLHYVHLNFPLHYEIDLSKKFTRNNEVFDSRNRSWRLGVGGYVGFRIGTRQYVEYRDPNRTKVKRVEKDNFNMGNHTYGLSSYIAHRNMGLYIKYDLNPLFKGTDTRNISMGIRFDID